MTPIKSFKDLNAWRCSHELVIMIYVITKLFPDSEKFGLVNQMRRSAVSISSNISEGFTRPSIKEKIQFYAIAGSSSAELYNQLIVAKDVGYLSFEFFQKAEESLVRTQKILGGLVRKTKERLKSQSQPLTSNL